MVIQDSKIRGLFTFAYFCRASAEARHVLAAAMAKPLQITTETSCIELVLNNIAGAKNAFYRDPKTTFLGVIKPSLNPNGYNLKV